MKKHILDLQVVSCEHIGERHALLRLAEPKAALPPMMPGQFAQVRVDGTADTFLRRPVSIHRVDYEASEVQFLIQVVGSGTAALAALKPCDAVNVVMPLGNGFTLPNGGGGRALLVGGGVGVAPLLYLGQRLGESGCRPTFLMGARSGGDLLRLAEYEKLGDVYATTEDGSAGEKGLVTQHSILREQTFDKIFCCGPKPMMMAVADVARKLRTECEVSLENMMACGLGACLCCVEETRRGNVRVCAEGPVFNINELKWLI